MKVPPVGESITEVTLASWKKKTGDKVTRDEILCELESDKATFELPAESDGILTIIAKEGDTLPIGAVVCSIEPVGAAAAVAPVAVVAEANIASAGSGKVIDIVIPAVGESITEVTIASWAKKDGDAVNMDDVLCELESDKATFELPAETAGTIKILVKAGETVAIGTAVAQITVGAGAAASIATAPIAADKAPATAIAAPVATEKHISPVAANILAEKGIDPATVNGTGFHGKIMKDDAISATKATNVSTPVVNSVSAPATPTDARGGRREKMSSLRKTIAKRLVAVKNETAMLTTFNEVDMKPIMDLRALYKDKFKEKHGVGLGFMSFFTKAVTVALKEYPAINAKIDGDEIAYHDYCDISIAVSAPKGLMVPVIRNAETLSLAGIESEIVRLATKAKENKLTLDEMNGGTFTITNGGIFGSMLSTPIINAPQVAILGMHNIVERPVVVAGQIVIRPIMYLALSYDHRIIDGKESVSFLVRLKQLLEDPTRLLLDV